MVFEELYIITLTDLVLKRKDFSTETVQMVVAGQISYIGVSNIFNLLLRLSDAISLHTVV